MTARNNNCEKKVAVITGGSRGFGEVLVKTFSQNGWNVAFSGRNVSNMSSETVVSQQADTANACDMESFFSKVVQKWKRIDTLIVNAGKNLDALFLKTSSEDIDAVCDTNLKGFYVAVHCVFPYMICQKKGHIIVLSSFAATHGRAGQALYCATKAALCGAVKSLARETGKDGIQANIVLPGFLPIGMGASATHDAREKAQVENILGQLASPEESAGFIEYLAGMKSVSGQIFNLDSRITQWM